MCCSRRCATRGLVPIRKELRAHYRTAAWRAARAEVIERAGGRCEKCKLKDGAYYVWRESPYEGGRWIEVTKQDAAAFASQGWRTVHVQCGCAHVNGVAGDDRLSNLRWWCRADHLAHDRAAGFHRETRQTRKDRARPLLEALS